MLPKVAQIYFMMTHVLYNKHSLKSIKCVRYRVGKMPDFALKWIQGDPEEIVIFEIGSIPTKITFRAKINIFRKMKNMSICFDE